MPANGSGWFWHTLARETGRLGHLFSPGGQRGPWPWFPYALDNGAYACWTKKTNVFDDDKWEANLPGWRKLLDWASTSEQTPLWGIVPDVPGDKNRTLERWVQYNHELSSRGIPLGMAVQDGMVVSDVLSLPVQPSIICIGGGDEFKWGTLAEWTANFRRVHVLRCNSPSRLWEMEDLGVESCDGTGWNRGDRKQTGGLEEWARSKPRPYTCDTTPYVCRATRRAVKQSCPS